MSVSIDGAGSLIGVDQGLNIVGLTTLTGGILLDDSITHLGDTNTKIRFPAADTFTVETAGSERLRITSAGKIGINNSSPLYAMHFKNAMSSSPSFIHMEITGSNAVGGGGGIQFDTSASNTEANNGLYLATISGVRNSADDGSNDLVFKTSKSGVAGDDGNTHSPKEKLRITSGGNLDLTGGGNIIINEDSKLFFEGDADDDLNAIYRNSSENTTILTARYNIANIIDSNNDDAASFWSVRHNATTLAGSGELMRVQSDGKVGINSTSPYGLFDILGQTTEDNIFNVWSFDKDSRVSLWPSDDHDIDRWRMAFFENNANGNNDYPDWAVDGNGRQWMVNNLYIGRTRTFTDSPTSLYPYYGNSGPAILIYNGVDGDTTNYSASLRVRCYQTDTDDRNIIYYANAGTSSVLDDDQDQTFGVKATGRVQGKRSFYCGRVESDETTPNSVYSTSSNGVYAYEDSAEGNVRMIAYSAPSTSHYSFYAETGTSTANDDVQFKVRSTDGRIYSDYGASVTSGADYAESFEWHDGNPDNEDRVGYSVVLQDGKIRKALDSDDTSLIIGIISAAPAVLGDSADLKWQGRYLKDDFGREVMQDVELLVWNHGQFETQPDINDTFRLEHCDSSCKVSEINEKLASGEIKQWIVDQNLRITSQQRVPNPDYNSSNVYVPRSERPEWDPVGLMGKLWMRPNQSTGDRWVKLRDGNNGLTYWLVR